MYVLSPSRCCIYKSLLRSDVHIDARQYALSVKLRFMKNAQFADSVHTVMIAGVLGHPLDPVMWYRKYVQMVPAPESASAFSFPAAAGSELRPLVHSAFVSKFKALLCRAGIQADAFSGHSFRRGAASFSYLVGIGEFMIQHMGAWKSQVYKVYCDLSAAQKLAVHKHWFVAMGQGQLGAELHADTTA